MKVLNIIHGSIVDGEGMRTSIYFAGCKHRCKGCHNPQSWDFNSGVEMSVNEIFEDIKKNNFNVTYSGGDPLYQNLDDLVSLSKGIHGIGLDIWLYTGFVFEELLEDLKCKDILDNVDVIVDGPFIEEKKDLNLLFRGSSNQRILKKGNGNFVEVKY